MFFSKDLKKKLRTSWVRFKHILGLGSLLQAGKKQYLTFEGTRYVHYIIIVESQYCDENVLASTNKLIWNKNETKIKSSPILILRFLQ